MTDLKYFKLSKYCSCWGSICQQTKTYAGWTQNSRIRSAIFNWWVYKAGPRFKIVVASKWKTQQLDRPNSQVDLLGVVEHQIANRAKLGLE